MTAVRRPPLASPDTIPFDYFTKWDYCGPRLREELDRTSFNGACSACGLTLETEGDFARHFFIPDARYLNLGECPNDGKAVRLPVERCDGCGGYSSADHYREDDRGYLRPLCYHCDALVARFTPTA